MTAYEHEDSSNTFILHVPEGEKERTVRVRKLIDATGPWIDRTRAMGRDNGKDYILPVAGSHIMLPSFLPCSVLLQAKDSRFFFAIEHGRQTRVGTTERVTQDLDLVKPTEEEVDYLLASLKKYFPSKNFTRQDISSQDAGVRPLSAPGSSKDPNEISREHEIRVSHSGCIHMVGVKLTDHRRAAEKVVDRLVPLLLPHNPNIRRKTLTHRLPLIET